MAHVIAILNPKGGTGKTTLSINLARAFQRSGFRVLIVDSDPQGTPEIGVKLVRSTTQKPVCLVSSVWIGLPLTRKSQPSATLST
ncbi:MAG: AAA family ATPase [Candidatus Competibacteraceae bacterium]|nr:AAA family ATPase [Candidatus Competibacteraceae bacterium]